jgi:hypothetical protein
MRRKRAVRISSICLHPLLPHALFACAILDRQWCALQAGGCAQAPSALASTSSRRIYLFFLDSLYDSISFTLLI